MRLSLEQISFIRTKVGALAGESARVWLFGSRVSTPARGGDVDLLVELDEAVAEPAQLSARLAAQVSRNIHGRKVDVVIAAPNLMNLSIHAMARSEGVRL